MKKTVRYILLLAIFTGFYKLHAQEAHISLKEAQQVAENFLAPFSSKSQNAEIYPIEGINNIYHFQSEKHFIFISSNKASYPVLGFGSFNPKQSSDFPTGLSLLLQSWHEQLKVIESQNISPSKNMLLQWQKLQQKSTKEKEDIAPMLYTTWNQGCYYNSAFPVDSSGSCNHPYTGCVATALSQIMKFYNFPISGTGSNSVFSPYGLLEVNFEEANYAWELMENNLTGENEAVAELMFHNAIAVNSLFLPGGTGAWDEDARDALTDYYNYRDSAQFLYRNSWFGDWPELLKDELNAGRPVIYGAVDQSNSAGHTFIIDGQFDEELFHVNWGWGGTYNGYFYLDTLAAGPYNFNIQHDMVFGIYPNIPDTLSLSAPQNLEITAIINDVTLSWQPPQAGSTLPHLGYHVFRNDSLLNGQMITSQSYTDENVPQGDHTYKVHSSFAGKNLGPGISESVYISSLNEHWVDQFDVYPNPGKGEFTIHLASFQQTVNIKVTDISGKLILDLMGKEIYTNRFNLNLASTPGIYFLTVETDQFRQTEKLIITN